MTPHRVHIENMIEHYENQLKIEKNPVAKRMDELMLERYKLKLACEVDEQ